MASYVSTLTCLWVIEALASFKQVDASILIDLLQRTPEISDDLGKNARELIYFRILESFFAGQSGSTKGTSAPDSRVELDPSKHCEDVVQLILHEMPYFNPRMDEPHMLKWDVQTFIMHKRASLPKCTLQQMKDAILEGNNPILACLKEHSRLSPSNRSGNRISMDDANLSPDAGGAAGGNLTSPTPENVGGLLQEDAATTTLLPSKRDRSDSDTEDLAAKCHEEGISPDKGSDSHLHAAKKLKHDASFSSQAVIPVTEKDLSEDLLRSDGQPLVKDGCNLAKLSHGGRSSEESTFTEDSHEHYISSKRHGQGNGDDASALLHNHPLIFCNNNTVPQDSCGDGPPQNLPANEAKDDEKQCVGTSKATPEYRDKCENTKINTSNGVLLLDGNHQKDVLDDAKEDMEHNPRGEMEHNPRGEMSTDSDGYQDEKIEVALKKRVFLSSECTFSQDSLTIADCTELNLCMKCNKGGQLLVCSGNSCPIVVHQSCLSSAPRFADNGKFYCPFCAYSRAISEYLEIKKKASLARNDLAVFIGLENGHRVYERTKRVLLQEQNQFIPDENVNGNNPANYDKKTVDEVNSTLYRGNIEDKKQSKPSVSRVNDSLPCQEEGVTLDDGTIGALPEVEREGPQWESGSALEGQQIEEGGGCGLGDDNLTCRDREIGPETKVHNEDVMQEEVLQQPITNRQAARRPNIDVAESSEEENDTISNYCISHRRREKQYSYPAVPDLRRKKVLWTSAEEEILKEGIRRFSSIHARNIPWKKILEFGSDVFLKGRTSIDLKDKWRNICKGSPKKK